MSRAVVFTDGACSRNGYDGASAGIGVKWTHKPGYDISESLDYGRQTNQRAEIEAARRGIELAQEMGYDRVTVKLDSMYVINAATKWLPKWERNGFINARGQPVANQRELKGLSELLDEMDVRFHWVPSERNIADPLARAATRADY